MVHVFLLIFLSVIETAFLSTAVEVCPRDNYNLDDVCSESKDASFFLQSSKTAIRAAGPQPELTKKQKRIEKHLEHIETIDAAKMKAELAAAVKVLKAEDAEKHEDTELTETAAHEERHKQNENVRQFFSQLIEDEEKEGATGTDDLKKYVAEFVDREDMEKQAVYKEEEERRKIREKEDTRIDAKTGVSLSLEEFKTFFGDEWKARWESAVHAKNDGAQKVKQTSMAPAARQHTAARKAMDTSSAVEKHRDLWKRVAHHKKGPPEVDEEEKTQADAFTFSGEPVLPTESILKENITARSRVSKVAEFDCTANGGPLQLLMEGQKGFVIKALNVETGKYSKVFSIPFARTTPKYSDLNSCGINPIDGILYCGLKQGSNFVVRVDAQKVEFVAKLPQTKFYTSGTFGPGGSFFIANDKAQFAVVPDLSGRPGFPTKNNKQILDLSGDALIKPAGFKSAADVVTVRANLEGLGDKVYMIVVNKGFLQIASYEDKKFKKTWVMKYKRGNKKGTFKEKWGAGWSFGGKVFFASNDGYGVYQVPLADLDLRKPIAQLEPITMPRIGDSDKSGNNDGANCMNAPDPWATKIAPWNCKVYSAPAQVMKVPTGYAVKTVNMATGAYTNVYNLPYARTTPAYKFLNAVGISPVDGIPYGCLLFGKFPAPIHIVRFDKDKFEFVAKIKGAFDPIAGTFTSTGDYFFVHNTKNSMHPVLYSISGLDGMTGYAKQTAPKLPVLSLTGFTLRDFTQFADIVAVKYPLEGGGRTMGEYILAINRDRQVALVKWNSGAVGKSQLWRLRTNDVTASVGAYENFGAAWNYEGRVFFASNNGIGVFETTQINLARKTIFLKKVGKSARIYNNDGFNCWKVESPFPNENPKVPVISAFKLKMLRL